MDFLGKIDAGDEKIIWISLQIFVPNVWTQFWIVELPAMPTADAGCLRCHQLAKLGLRLHAELASQGMRRVRPHLDPSRLESGARNEVLWSLDQGTSH